MNRLLLVISIVIFGVSLFAITDNGIEALWKKIPDKVQYESPRTALETVEEIMRIAREKHDDDQYLKAIFTKLDIQDKLNETDTNDRVDYLLKECAIADAPVKNILHFAIGQVYLTYMDDNSWRIDKRSEHIKPVSDDLSTWSKRELIERAVLHFGHALDHPEILKQIPVTRFPSVIQPGDPANALPTLYDFLADSVQDSYTSCREVLAPSAKRRLVNVDQLMIPLDQFLIKWAGTSDTLTIDGKITTLWCDVLQFRKEVGDPYPLVNADLERLFIFGQSLPKDQRNTRLETLLNGMSFQYGKSDKQTRCRILLELARVQNGMVPQDYEKLNPELRWKRKDAVANLEASLKLDPTGYFSNECESLLESIRAQSAALSIMTDQIPNRDIHIGIKYKNVKRVWLWIIPGADPFVKHANNENERFIITSIQEKKYIRKTAINLPDYLDFQVHTCETAIQGLPIGHYYVLITSTEAPGKGDLRYNTIHLSVSNLCVMINTSGPSRGMTILDRKDGRPVPKVRVEFWKRAPNNLNGYILNSGIKSLTSDREGKVRLPSDNMELDSKLKLILGEDIQIVDDPYNANNDPDSLPILRTKIFLDRAIYRPGQTIHFKGVQYTEQNDDYQPVTHSGVTVRLKNPHWEDTQSVDLVTDEFGAFKGAFILPTGCLTGDWCLESGSVIPVEFRVEEYKRPRFEVTFEKPEGEWRIGEKVSVTGKAVSFNESPLSDANVAFKVTYSSYRSDPSGKSRMPDKNGTYLTSGTTRTNPDGTFIIDFEAAIDPEILEYKRWVYVDIVATVTDISGETRSGYITINLGLKSLFITLDEKDFLDIDKGLEIGGKTSNANAKPIPATLRYTIARLKTPNRPLFNRLTSVPDTILLSKPDFIKRFPYLPYGDENDPTTWLVEKIVAEGEVNSDGEFRLKSPNGNDLIPGVYRFIITGMDSFGSEVREEKTVTCYSKTNLSLPSLDPLIDIHIKTKAIPGEVCEVMIGSGFQNANVHLITNGYHEQIDTTCSLNREMKRFTFPVTEADEGGFSLDVILISDNRVISRHLDFSVIHPKRTLEVKTKSFRDKLSPGSQETWELTIEDYQGNPVDAIFTATMYDLSLDTFWPHDWHWTIYRKNRRIGFCQTHLGMYYKNVSARFSTKPSRRFDPHRRRPGFINWLLYKSSSNRLAYSQIDQLGGGFAGAGASEASSFRAELSDNVEEETMNTVEGILAIQAEKSDDDDEDSGTSSKKEKAFPVQIRRNLQETAFFMPDLRTDEKGSVILTFTAPEALTRWKMMGLAHTKDLAIGSIVREVITEKPLMVVPNPPRFLRTGDRVELATKVVNRTDSLLSGEVCLRLFDAVTMKPVDAMFGLQDARQPFTMAGGQSTVGKWTISVPAHLQAVIYRFEATSGHHTDGEEAALPILSEKMLVTDTLPLNVREGEEKTVRFTAMDNALKSSTAEPHRLTVEFTPNPVWYAVQAIPYLMEYPYECSEQVFHRYYANKLSSWIIDQNPGIRRVFERWKAMEGGLLSNLEKNPELKSIIIAETPWLRDAENETESKRRLGLLMDLQNMATEEATALEKLRKAQLPSGAWPWFAGMYESRWVTMTILQGMGHLRSIGALDMTRYCGVMAKMAISWCDNEMVRDYKDWLKSKRSDKEPIPAPPTWIVEYLYTRALFGEVAVGEETREAYDHYVECTREHWLEMNHPLQARAALYFHNTRQDDLARRIMASIREYAIDDGDLGVYWKSSRYGEASIESQALMIEAFSEIGDDTRFVDSLRKWLLRKKQTTNWQTTTATALACYALLSKGTDWLSEDGLIDLSVGDEQLLSDDKGKDLPEAGTGWIKRSWGPGEIDPDMARIEVKNTSSHIAWGGAYFQYFEDMDKVVANNTDLKIEKGLFIERMSPNGVVIEPLGTGEPLKIGDKVVIRLVIRSDRDYEYVHMKDYRASCFEPLDVLSETRWQDGLVYYQTTRDATTDFFFERLSKGTYVFEYALRVAQAGDFANGITNIQCMYAPEFSAHSAGIRIRAIDNKQ